MNIIPQIIKRLFIESPKPLGRWSIDKCTSSVSMTNYYSNIDHCGTCDYQKEMIEDIIRKERDKPSSNS